MGNFIVEDPKEFGDGSFVNVEYEPDDQFARIVEDDLTPVLLSGREIDTVLVALRSYQRNGISNILRQEDLSDIATNGGEHTAMGEDEIDGLCDYLNR